MVFIVGSIFELITYAPTDPEVACDYIKHLILAEN
jgi:hypothetical protein